MYMCILNTCMSLYHMHACMMPMDARRRHLIPRNCRYRWLCVSILVLEQPVFLSIEPSLHLQQDSVSYFYGQYYLSIISDA